MLIYAFLIPHSSLTLYGASPCSNAPKLIQPHLPKPKQPHIPTFSNPNALNHHDNSDAQALNHSARHDNSDITVRLPAHEDASPAIAKSPSWMAPSAVDVSGSVAC